MTYLQLVNAVLRRLREDEVTSVSENEYSTLIGDFVNEAKRRVEDAHSWNVLRETVRIATTAGTFRYSMEGVQDGFRILDVYNDTDDSPIRQMNQRAFTRLTNGSDATQASPHLYSINGKGSDGKWVIDFWGVPDAVYNINVDIVNPQADLEEDGVEMNVPSPPVILFALAKAISERGDDAGQQFGEVWGNAEIALADAIGNDSALNIDEHTWFVI